MIKQNLVVLKWNVFITGKYTPQETDIYLVGSEPLASLKTNLY